MKLEHGQTVLFTGDSITDSDIGRSRPIGEGEGLGNGYVNLIDSLLAVWHPDFNLRILNSGISGNRVTDLESRWQEDVLAHKPDWLSIMIGINDVWRQFDGGFDPDRVDLRSYETTYRRILDQTRPLLKGLVLMTPYFLETNRADPMRAMMDSYSEVVERLADDYAAIFVNVQAAFDRYLQHRPTQSLCDDRVHPSQTGHMVIAKAFLTAIEFDWHAG